MLAEALRKDPHAFALAIVLPLGISFHTFQSMSYVVDVYRGEQKAIRNPIDYALFIAFFPQLVAGPIVRAREFFADLLQVGASGQRREAARSSAGSCWGWPRRWRWPISSRRSRIRYFQEPGGASRRAGCLERRGRFRHADLFRFFRLHRHGHRHGAAAGISLSRSTFAGRIWRSASPISGIAGTFRYRAGCAIICTFRWAATGTAR